MNQQIKEYYDDRGYEVVTIIPTPNEIIIYCRCGYHYIKGCWNEDDGLMSGCVLYHANSHPRDKQIVFDEIPHIYTILHDKGMRYKSVTTLVHEQFSTFNADEIIHKMMTGSNWNERNKYWGMTPKQIKSKWANDGKESASLGTKLHYDIECFMDIIPTSSTHQQLLTEYNTTLPIHNTSKEWNHFLKFVKHHPDLVPYRTEWMVYDEDLKLSGSIDMVYKNEDNTLSIYDWKRSKSIPTNNPYRKFSTTPSLSHVPDTNLWHYSLQLNIYKAILERKYGKKVKELYLVRLHPNANIYELIPCEDMTKEVEQLFNDRLTSNSL